jgi:hypothetical protein
MDTENIDKLFLELSQVTKAKTQKEIELEKLIKIILCAWNEDGRSGKNNHIFNRASVRVKFGMELSNEKLTDDEIMDFIREDR